MTEKQTKMLSGALGIAIAFALALIVYKVLGGKVSKMMGGNDVSMNEGDGAYPMPPVAPVAEPSPAPAVEPISEATQGDMVNNLDLASGFQMP